MAGRLKKTLVDYLVIAISPALIITLVGSLVFFLLEVFYHGNFPLRLHYVFALFIIGAVLISRISIEDGRERSALFALPLAIVTLLAINKFVRFQGDVSASLGFFINVGLIALTWWSADKLTWDCTLIDEDEEDSGEGLLQAVGLDRPGKAALQREIAPVATDSRPGKPAGWWKRLVQRGRRPPAPGVWIVYFSLAALPLFGIGQMFLPADSLSARQYAFCLLCTYTASGLGLLLATKFSGLAPLLAAAAAGNAAGDGQSLARHRRPADRRRHAGGDAPATSECRIRRLRAALPLRLARSEVLALWQRPRRGQGGPIRP